MTKRQKNAQETRQKIYDAACSLIEGKGFANVSVEDIANACGDAVPRTADELWQPMHFVR